MKFLHTADIHFGDSWKTLTDGLNLKRQETAFDEIYEVAYNYEVDIIVIAGDLIHQKNPSRETRDLVLKKVLEYDRKGFKTLIMEGNHDNIDAKSSNIHFLRLLYKAKKLTNTAVIELKNTIIRFNDGAFLVMPNFNEIELRKMANKFSDLKWRVAVLHTTTIGAVDDKEWMATRQGWDMKNIKNITYYAFGHIHKYQRLSLSNAWQSGSPIQHNFGEKLPKGVLVVDTDNPENPEFVPIKKPKPFYVIKDINKVPKNGYVKLLTNKSIIGTNLPSNIVATERDLSNIKIEEYKGELNPLKGLTEELAKQGLTNDEQLLGVQMIEKIVNNLDK